MFSLDTESGRVRRLPVKTATAYFAVALLCILITNVYALYGHGIRSESMDFMFLYPLVGGTVVFLLMAFILPRLPEKSRSIYRVAYNLYNSGIASLTSAAMLTGIVEIAGTASELIQYIKLCGVVLTVAAVVCQIVKSVPR
ncbi:MAG: hypothetical protein FWH55_09805 [Oscillospiraceae bacterium]|nr:hypothetical protein [Oscillospiraceae bacterium]